MNHLRTDAGAQQLEVDGTMRETEAPNWISLGDHCAIIRLLSSGYDPSAQSARASSARPSLNGGLFRRETSWGRGSNELTTRGYIA